MDQTVVTNISTLHFTQAHNSRFIFLEDEVYKFLSRYSTVEAVQYMVSNTLQPNFITVVGTMVDDLNKLDNSIRSFTGSFYSNPPKDEFLTSVMNFNILSYVGLLVIKLESIKTNSFCTYNLKFANKDISPEDYVHLILGEIILLLNCISYRKGRKIGTFDMSQYSFTSHLYH